MSLLDTISPEALLAMARRNRIGFVTPPNVDVATPHRVGSPTSAAEQRQERGQPTPLGTRESPRPG